MARYDAHVNPEGPGWLLDVQADELSAFRTRRVVPLVDRKSLAKVASRLNPVFATDHGNLVLLTHLMFAVPRVILKRAAFNLAAVQDEIKSALDMAFYGF